MSSHTIHRPRRPYRPHAAAVVLAASLAMVLVAGPLAALCADCWTLRCSEPAPSAAEAGTGHHTARPPADAHAGAAADPGSGHCDMSSTDDGAAAGDAASTGPDAPVIRDGGGDHCAPDPSLSTTAGVETSRVASGSPAPATVTPAVGVGASTASPTRHPAPLDATTGSSPPLFRLHDALLL